MAALEAGVRARGVVGSTKRLERRVKFWGLDLIKAFVKVFAECSQAKFHSAFSSSRRGCCSRSFVQPASTWSTTFMNRICSRFSKAVNALSRLWKSSPPAMIRLCARALEMV